MIGWWIVIAAQTPEERDTGIGRRDAVLANWETSVGGNGWVQRLVDEGKAVNQRAKLTRQPGISALNFDHPG